MDSWISALREWSVASRAGYQSEAAFGRAFKQFFGVPPGGVRRLAAA